MERKSSSSRNRNNSRSPSPTKGKRSRSRSPQRRHRSRSPQRRRTTSPKPQKYDSHSKSERERSPSQSSSESSSEGSDSSSNTSNSSSESENEKSHKKEKHKKEKKDKKSKKDKKNKKEKKEKKHKKEKKDNNSDSEDSPRKLKIDVHHWKDHYYEKHVEFKVWLLEHKKIYFDTLNHEKEKKFFIKFAKRWNKGKLENKYYNGINETELEGKFKSSHKWRFKISDDEKLSMESARDTVDNSTNHLSMQAFVESEKTHMLHPSMQNIAQHVHDYDVNVRKSELKKKREWQNNVIEEAIGPKPVGREAMIEKKRARSEQQRERENSPDNEDNFNDSSASDFKRMLERERAKKAKKTEFANQRVSELQAKEKERMDNFKRQAGLL